MTRRTSDPAALYQQTPILIDTLAEYAKATPLEVADVLVWEANHSMSDSDEQALRTTINDFVAP